MLPKLARPAWPEPRRGAAPRRAARPAAAGREASRAPWGLSRPLSLLFEPVPPPTLQAPATPRQRAGLHDRVRRREPALDANRPGASGQPIRMFRLGQFGGDTLRSLERAPMDWRHAHEPAPRGANSLTRPERRRDDSVSPVAGDRGDRHPLPADLLRPPEEHRRAGGAVARNRRERPPDRALRAVQDGGRRRAGRGAGGPVPEDRGA